MLGLLRRIWLALQVAANRDESAVSFLAAALDHLRTELLQYEPGDRVEFAKISRHALELAELVRSLVESGTEALSAPYQSFAIEAEDFALGAQFEPEQPVS